MGGYDVTGAGPDARPGAGRQPAPATVEPGAGAQRGTGAGHIPRMAGGAAGGQGSTHTRPSWLVQDDPESIWMSGLPPHGPAVIE